MDFSISWLLYHSFARCYLWEELAKGYMGSLLYFITAWKFTIVSK